MRMSLESRREYLATMCQRYHQASTRKEKTNLIEELVSVLEYNRKYAIQVLGGPPPATKRPTIKRTRPLRYLEALPVIQVIWEALDYPCAERLHPVLSHTAELLAAHGELKLTGQIRQQLEQISRPTLARRIGRWSSPKAKRSLPHPKPGNRLRSEIPVDRFAWNENRPGALELDLVEHNGGSSLGHFAYTLTVVDVVTGYSRRRAVLGRGQTGVFREIDAILSAWPSSVWGFHTDNGSEFINDQLSRFCKEHGLSFTRSRPYHKNDNAHAEQKNRQYVRDIVGYERYDTPQAVNWLNEVYACLDPYVNLFIPMRKVIVKQRCGSHVHKSYDTAAAPVQRLLSTQTVDLPNRLSMQQLLKTLNPMALHRQLEELLAAGPLQVTMQSLPLAHEGLG